MHDRNAVTKKAKGNGNEKEEKILNFNKENLITAKATLAIRKENTLKYADIQLPNHEDETSLGYHQTCYRRFTALSAPHRKKLEERVQAKNTDECNESTDRLTRSTITSPQSSSTGVLKKVCLFCGRDTFMLNNTRLYLSSAQTKDFENNIK